jgi:hypothetical protein
MPGLAVGPPTAPHAKMRLASRSRQCPRAKVAELADAPDLGSGGATHGGSSPPFRTNPHRERNAKAIPSSNDQGKGLSPCNLSVVVGRFGGHLQLVRCLIQQLPRVGCVAIHIPVVGAVCFANLVECFSNVVLRCRQMRMAGWIDVLSRRVLRRDDTTSDQSHPEGRAKTKLRRFTWENLRAHHPATAAAGLSIPPPL